MRKLNVKEKLYEKRTENGDVSYNSTGDNLLDILFMTSYFEKHIEDLVGKIGVNGRDKLFAMFIRDPRYGLGRRDLGRALMYLSDVSKEDVVKCGRFDDLLYMDRAEDVDYVMTCAMTGNELAKKWLPRYKSERGKELAIRYKLSPKEYRKIKKCESLTEYKLSYSEKVKTSELNEIFNHGGRVFPLRETIDFEKVPSLAMIRYAKTFMNLEETKENYAKYLEEVKEGKKELKVSTTTVYDIYKNRDKIDCDVFFDKIEKIKINCIPILDTSGSMLDRDNIGKAMSIAHYLAKCSTYCPNQVISFSSNPKLITLDENCTEKLDCWYYKLKPDSKYEREILSMYTGDCSNTNLSKVMKLLTNLDKELPEYLVILSDMEFDVGSNMAKDELMKLWKSKGYKTKIVWWNFNSRNKTVPEQDEHGNIYMSGYSPMLLKYLESGFNGEMFLNKLLVEYKNKIDNSEQQ